MMRHIDKELVFLQPFALHPVNAKTQYLVAFELDYWYFVWINKKLFSVPKSEEHTLFEVIEKERIHIL